MDYPFEPEVDLSFLSSASAAIEDGQIYLEQPNILQVEDIKDFSQPIFVEIKPLISFPMDEDIEDADAFDSPTWTSEVNENGIGVAGENALVMSDPDHDLNHETPANRAQTINPLLLNASASESLTDHEEIQPMEERVIHPEAEGSITQQDTAPVNLERVDLAPASEQPADGSNILMEHVLNERLEQDKADVSLNPDPDGPSSWYPTTQDMGSADTLFLEETGAMDTRPDIRNDATDPFPPGLIQNGGPFENESVPSQVRPGLPVFRLKSELTTYDNVEGKFEQIGCLNDASTSAVATPIPAIVDAPATQAPFPERFGRLNDASTSAIATPTPAVADAPATQAPRCAKRRKMMLDAVEIPILPLVTKEKYMDQHVHADDKKLEILNSEKMMKHLKNPKVKKDQACVLTAGTVRDRLQQIGLDPFPIALPKSITDATFQRDFLSRHYGGNMRATFPIIRRDMIAATGLDDFMYINLRYNPHAPEMPGAPGLWYTVGQGRRIARAHPWTKEQRVMSRLVTGIWQYQGQYALIPADSLTKEEWASEYMGAGDPREKVGSSDKSRIVLRVQLGRLPTRVELAAALQTDSKYNEVTPAQITRALLRGEETMAAWAMKCVGYDKDFQQGLIEKQKTWVPPKKTKKGTRKAKKAASSKPGISRKRKVVEVGSESSSDEDFSGSDDDEVHVISRIKSGAMHRRSRHTT
ncbi:hypothetical protein J132_07054 [Termitomyces sp. J132]|nr:hypothetical protein J132_07054 [Termitomyces sp. J132]